MRESRWNFQSRIVHSVGPIAYKMYRLISPVHRTLHTRSPAPCTTAQIQGGYPDTSGNARVRGGGEQAAGGQGEGCSCLREHSPTGGGQPVPRHQGITPPNTNTHIQAYLVIYTTKMCDDSSDYRFIEDRERGINVRKERAIQSPCSAGVSVAARSQL